jgi:hypothetical protein
MATAGAKGSGSRREFGLSEPNLGAKFKKNAPRKTQNGVYKDTNS